MLTGTLPRNKPSTVVDLSKSDVKILRQGDLNFLGQNIFLKHPMKQKYSQTNSKNVETRHALSLPNKPLILLLKEKWELVRLFLLKGLANNGNQQYYFANLCHIL